MGCCNLDEVSKCTVFADARKARVDKDEICILWCRPVETRYLE